MAQCVLRRPTPIEELASIVFHCSTVHPSLLQRAMTLGKKILCMKFFGGLFHMPPLKVSKLITRAASTMGVGTWFGTSTHLHTLSQGEMWWLFPRVRGFWENVRQFIPRLCFLLFFFFLTFICSNRNYEICKRGGGMGNVQECATISSRSCQ